MQAFSTINHNWSDRRRYLPLSVSGIASLLAVSIAVGANEGFVVSVVLGLVGFMHVLLVFRMRVFLLTYILVNYAIGFAVGMAGFETHSIFHVGEIGGGVSLNGVIILAFVGLSWFYIFIREFSVGGMIAEYLRRPGSRFLIGYTGGVCAVLVIQIVVAGRDPFFFVRKGRETFSILPLSLLLWFVFDREGDEWRILKFSLLSFLAISAVAVIFGGERPIDRGGRELIRLEPLWPMGANSGATVFAMYIPYVFLAMRRSRDVVAKGWWFVVGITAICLIIWTTTRAAILALLFAFSVALLLWRDERWGIGTARVVLVLFLGLGLAFVGSSVLGTFFGEHFWGYDFRDRLYRLWLPSISYVLGHRSLWYGMPVVNFNKALLAITGRSHAHHNMTVGILTLYGLPVALLWLGFWFSILWRGFSEVRRATSDSSHRQLAVASILSLIIYVMCAHSASVMSVFFLTPVFVHIYLLWRALDVLRSTREWNSYKC